MSHTSRPDPLSVNCPTCSAPADTLCVSEQGSVHHGRVHAPRFAAVTPPISDLSGSSDFLSWTSPAVMDRPPSAAGAQSPLFPGQDGAPAQSTAPVPRFPTVDDVRRATGANGDPMQSPRNLPPDSVKTLEPRRNPRAFQQYEIALSLYRLVAGNAEFDVDQRAAFANWANGLLPHQPVPVDDRIDLDESLSLCLWASIESAKPAVTADVFRKLGGFPQLLKLFWAQRSLVELLGVFEETLRTRKLDALLNTVKRVRVAGELVGHNLVAHERDQQRLGPIFAPSPRAELQLAFVSQLTDIELADHLKRALHSGFRVPFHSAFEAVAKLRAAIGVEAKPSAPGEYEKRRDMEVAMRVADGPSVGSADALELWALLDDIDTASDMLKPEKSPFYEYVMGRAKLRFSIMSPHQHDEQLRLVAPSNAEVARRERDKMRRKIVRLCLRRAADWRKQVSGDPSTDRESRAREAETIAAQVGVYLDAPTDDQLSRRKAVRDVLDEVCRHARLGTDVSSVLSDYTERLLTIFES